MRIGHQVQQLPGDVAEALTLTHHRVLLAVDDAARKVQLATAAVSQGWTTDQLAEEVQKARPKDATKAGRPPLPPNIKVLGQVQRAWARGVDGELLAKEIAGLEEKDKLAAVAGLQVLAGKLAKVLAELGAAG